MRMTFDLDAAPAKPATPEPLPVPTAPPIEPVFTELAPVEIPPPAANLISPAATEMAPPDEPENAAPELVEVLPPVAPAPEEDPESAPLPQVLSERPITPTMRKRFDGHAAVNKQIKADWMKVIDQDRFRFEALLYRPVDEVPTALDEDGIEAPVFTEINNHQKELEYHDPVIVNVLDSPDQREQFTATDDDTGQDGLVDDFLILRVSTTGIPIGSIMEWLEEDMEGGSVRRFWYVLRIYSYGTQAVGSLYYCIPARNIDGSAEVVRDVQ